VLVAFTDGVSEAMNAEMAEWGEERLVDAAVQQRALSPLALIEHLVSEADRFVAGAPQHDDMTVVVVQRK
jgi:sigma-B regulation protein RsbU (phosphoserine phosphatase)